MRKQHPTLGDLRDLMAEPLPGGSEVCVIKASTLRKLAKFKAVYTNDQALISEIREPALEVALAFLHECGDRLPRLQKRKGGKLTKVSP